MDRGTTLLDLVVQRLQLIWMCVQLFWMWYTILMEGYYFSWVITFVDLVSKFNGGLQLLSYDYYFLGWGTTLMMGYKFCGIPFMVRQQLFWMLYKFNGGLQIL